MLLTKAKDFLAILNTDALLFLGTRLASIVFSIASVILLCQAVTEQRYFFTDGLGVMYDLVPLASLAYTLVWSVVSLILPGCHRKYNPALDMAFDFLGFALSLTAGGALLSWALKDAYEADICLELALDECTRAAETLSGTEKSGAVLLLFTGVTHFLMFLRATRAVYAHRKHYRPSRNSFMQLEKSAGQQIEMSPLHLNTTTLAALDQKRKDEEEANKQSVDSSTQSPA